MSYHDRWLENGVAVLSGESRYLKKLASLARGDTFLAYAKRTGIVARGVVVDDTSRVVKRGDGTVSPKEPLEYHRKIMWTADLRSSPVTVGEIIAIHGSNPRHALAELIEGKSEVLTLVEERSEEIDLAEIEQRAAGRTTEMLALRQARRGQGKYRDDLLNLWGKACAVTDCDLESVLRASHALPWKDSTDEQRLDPNNGLLLVPTLDALFDSGLIGFSDKGTMLLSPLLEDRHSAIFGIPGTLRRPLSASQKEYLKLHREMFGLA